jgi:hypothetical protein
VRSSDHEPYEERLRSLGVRIHFGDAREASIVARDVAPPSQKPVAQFISMSATK